MKTILSLICLLSFASVLNGQKAGTLDKSFGDTGVVLTSYQNLYLNCYASAIQSDDKIVAVGSSNSLITDSTDGFLILRYMPDGELDSSFGTSGKVIVNFGYDAQDAYAVAIQSDGKIVVTGTGVIGMFNAFYDILTVRLNTNGALDKTFGKNGKVITDFGKDEYGNSIAIQPDGKIVLGGAYDYSNFLVVRLKTDGTLDRSFGTNGRVTTDFPHLTSIASIALESDGKIVAGGTLDGTYRDFLIARYTSSGSLDNTFGASGIVYTQFTNYGDLLSKLTLQQDGKIIAVGSTGMFSSNVNNKNILVARYKTNGNLDSAYGTNGKVTVHFVNEASGAYNGIIQTDGKLLIDGFIVPNSTTSYLVSRLLTNGNLDTSFGTNGSTATAFSLGYNTAYGIGLQSDGSIIAAGSSTSVNYDTLAVSLAAYNQYGVRQKVISKIKHYIQNHNNIESNSTADAKVATLNISIAPNPVNSMLTIKGLSVSTKYAVGITNENGNAVANKQINNVSSYQINVQGLSAGVYYINIISNNNQSTTLKFIKQ